jgi:tocopherol O-methyltransferase
LGTADEYRAWLQVAGLSVETTHDWTANVQRTWEICRQRVARRGVRQLARLLDANASIFLDRFDTLLNAYRSGAMRYGCLVARKPTTSGSIEQPTA